MKRIVLTALISLALSAPLSATTRVDLNKDWLFRTDPDQTGEKAGWQNHPPEHSDSVNVPHTWGLGRHDGYLGKAWNGVARQHPLNRDGRRRPDPL
jgi:hypothetical protein